MSNIYKIFEELRSNNSRNFKIEVLKREFDNNLLKEVCRLAMDPFTQFYIKKIPEYTHPEASGALSDALDRLKYLSNRTFTGNAGIEHLRDVLSSVSADDAKIIEMIISKDLDCGVQRSTLDKVWPGLIYEYPCLLCSAYDEKLVSKIQYPAYVQLKEDGMRFNAIVRNGTVEYRSRNGKELDIRGKLDADFLAYAQGEDLVFDGELLVEIGGKIAERQIGNGILNKANKGTISDAEAECVRAAIWDIIPYVDFIAGKSGLPYNVRLGKLNDLMLNGKVTLVPTNEVSNLEEAQVIFEKYLSEGKEGIILKSRNSLWEDGRSKSQIKFKGELECDLKIVALQEGSGKYEGKLGALVCESADGLIKVNVGSGLSDAQRTSFTSDILGKIVAVKYNTRLVNAAGEHTLFLPIFIELRFDKDVADSSGDIK